MAIKLWIVPREKEDSYEKMLGDIAHQALNFFFKDYEDFTETNLEKALDKALALIPPYLEYNYIELTQKKESQGGKSLELVKNMLKSLLGSLFRDETIRNFLFQKDKILKSEIEIVDETKGFSRLDLIRIDNQKKEVHIIDFKLHPLSIEEHRRQVRKYLYLAKKALGTKYNSYTFKGYLVYLDPPSIEEIGQYENRKTHPSPKKLS